MSQNHQIPSGTREEILRVAMRLFANRGYPQTSMEEIAKEVGISKPAIYHYFNGKEELFRTLLDAARRQHDAMIERLRRRHLCLPELVEANIRDALTLLSENPEWIRLMIRISSYPHELSEFEDMAALDRAIHGAEVRLVEEAACDLQLRPGLSMEDFVHYYHGVVFSFMARCLLTGEPIDVENTSRRLRDLILFGAFGRQP